jgi:hypothetical protein
MIRRTTTAAAVLLACFVASVATAEAKPSVAVLGIEVISKSGRVDAKTTNIAKKLTAELRRRASMGNGPFQLAPNSDKDLLELKLLSDCASEGRGCMSKIGADLKADRLLYGKLEKLGGKGYQVSLNLLNVGKRTMERNTSDLIPKTEVDQAGISKWARVLYNRLSGVPSQGSVVIKANVSSGTVTVDGEPKGSLSGGKLRISGLSAGSHKVRVESPGHQPYEGDVIVSAGEAAEVSASLQAKAIGGGGGTGTPGKAGRPGGTSRVLFWTSLVVTGLGATAVTVTGLQVRGSLKDDQEEAVRAWQNANGMELNQGNACADAATRSDALAKAVVDACDAGKSRANLTNIFLGATVASALAAGYFYWKGYIKAKKSTRSERMSRKRRNKRKHNVVVTPQLGPNQIGAGVAIEF